MSCKSLILHSCCAWCLTGYLTALLEENLYDDFSRIYVFWYNPNIHPYGEYRKRLKSFMEFTSGCLEKIVDPYRAKRISIVVHDLWEVEKFSPLDCARCWNLRLLKMKEVFSYIDSLEDALYSTTLLFSPYQRHGELMKVALDIFGDKFYYLNARKYWKEGTKRYSELGLYMQRWCGCVGSAKRKI